ncbi:MAG: toll/interleukin-1 receptor domain-containing protein, partial [Oscillospiraceae bacterium]|nr:toll/interleukin-1 receptor domain-containing protein [Oscillospiraceae bacterium]
MAFVYTTRGNSSPQGKPRVCFLSHKEDFVAYFDQLSGEILELQNCAIWHEARGEAGADVNAGAETAGTIDLSELDQMQLIVIPITRKLLASENEVLDRVLPYAIEKNIPILPIMVEGGLDAPFTEKFGDLEYLDKTAIDPTAIPYQERLGKFLSSVLLNDTQIEEIRSAFDAYIFLSYRKKDRAYANELMRLIHQNEFSEKVAIWYDEFLVPGESFNDAIEEALKKSNLFSLVVTPNLVNERNYVMEIEYPMAQKNNKTILP